MPKQDEELDEMPIWQNHEQRITALEVTMQGLSQKMDSLEETINTGNDEQLKKLDEMNNRLFDEFFKKKTLNLSNAWKLIIGILGGGGLIYLLIDKFF